MALPGINGPLIRNPLNWIIVILMTMVGLFLADTIIRWVRASRGVSPQTGDPLTAADASASGGTPAGMTATA